MRRRGRRISAGGIDTSRKSWAHHEMSFFWMMLQTLFIFGGDLLPVDPKLEHSMGHKISPAPHSRCSRRVKPKVSPAASTGCSLWLFPGSKEWATTTPAHAGECCHTQPALGWWTKSIWSPKLHQRDLQWGRSGQQSFCCNTLQGDFVLFSSWKPKTSMKHHLCHFPPMLPLPHLCFVSGTTLPSNSTKASP